MRYRRGFTLVELLIAMVVIAILAAISVVAYHGVQAAAIERVAQANLQTEAEAMQLAYQTAGEYPATLPNTSISPATNNLHTTNAMANTTNTPADSSTTTTNGGSTLTLKRSGTLTSYANLTSVQNGVLLAQICQDLINKGTGKGVDKGGNTQSYITGCGNWNKGSIQITGWNTKVWSTPVTSDQLTQYANSFTTNDSWNNAQIGVVKNFYTQLVQRQQSEGGAFPITTFWDSWATSKNGGVMYQALPATMQTKDSFCIEATTDGSNKVWHIDESGTVKDGSCEA